jgi:hypothetical protein
METAQQRLAEANQDNWTRHFVNLSKRIDYSNNSSNLLTSFVRQTTAGAMVVALPTGQQLPLGVKAPTGAVLGDTIAASKPSHSDKWTGIKP